MRKHLTIPTLTTQQLALFESKIFNHPGGCSEWRGSFKKSGGYGVFTINGVQYLAHRIAYTIAYGPIPNGLVVDHVKDRGCTLRNCVEPNHLEAVTDKVNVMRSNAPSAKNALKTHCKRGHEFTPGNTNLTKGRYGVQRQCRECYSHWSIEYQRRKRQAMSQPM